jgi:hypothetical protein
VPRARLPPALEDLAARFGREVAEVLKNAVAGAADDALERVEAKGREVVAGIGRARAVAQKRGRQKK